MATVKKTPVKKVVAKTAQKPVKKIVAKTEEKKAVTKLTGLEISVVGIDGKEKSTMQVPKELFEATINFQLLAQAVRVFLANQRTGGSSTKTRGEVQGSTRKIYRQKGTGKARHGGITAPVFVGGGIAFGPKPRDYRLNLPVKMRKTALASAITSQFKDKNIIVVDGLEALEPKTKLFASSFANIGADKKTLFIVAKATDTFTRATKNLSEIDTMPVSDMHAYAVVSHRKIVFTKDALQQLAQTFVH